MTWPIKRIRLLLSIGGVELASEDLAIRTSGLNVVRLQNVIAEAVKNGQSVTQDHVSRCKKILIEEFCQGLVKFKDPRPDLSLDAVATHRAAKPRLNECPRCHSPRRPHRVCGVCGTYAGREVAVPIEHHEEHDHDH